MRIYKTVLMILALLYAVPLAAGEAESAHSFGFTGLDGSQIDLSSYAGHPVLLVNTASKCGYTPQYEGLQALWTTYRDRGLVVLGVPSGDFRDQEYNDSDQIARFCQINYGVTFPLTEKNHVTGEKAHPVYRWLAREMGADSVPTWNFHKYLIGPDGKPIAWFPTKTKPGDPEVIAAIETALGATESSSR